MMIGYKDNTGVFLKNEEFEKRKKFFQLPNLEKQNKLRMQMHWSAKKMPDKISHFIKGKEFTQVPLGVFVGPLSEFIEDKTIDCSWAHPRMTDNIGQDIDTELRSMQLDAIEELLHKPVGYLHASTGTGKTYVLSKIISKLNQKTLIICSGLSLMTQMFYDIKGFFGVECETVSGKKTMGNYNGIVIANIDSLKKIQPEFMQQFGLIILDEADRYLQAPNRLKTLFSLSPNYLYGLTGTVKLNHVDDLVFPMYLGPKVELLKKNFQPTIYLTYTPFLFSDIELDDVREFHKLKSEMYTCPLRNGKIIDTVVNTLGDRKGILFTEYVDHAKLLKEELESKGIKTFMIIGEISKEERDEIKNNLMNHSGQCLLIGSVKCIGRGFNVPELSVGYLTVCEKFKSNIEQYVGRVIRKFPGKTKADWYDFVDLSPSILKNQHRSRLSTYKKEFPKSQIIYN